MESDMFKVGLGIVKSALERETSFYEATLSNLLNWIILT